MGRRGRGRKRKWQPEEGVAGALDRRGRAIIAGAEDHKPREARVEGALPGEAIVFLRSAREGPVDRAQLVELRGEPAAERVEARCVHYGMCGGCSLMHMDPEAQVAHKQAQLLADFAAAGVEPQRVLEPLRAEPWAYRRRARLGAKWVPGKDKVLVGFREKQDRRFIANLEGCEVLAGPGGALIPALSELIEGLSLRSKIPQVEISVGDEATALVLRVLEAPTDEDRDRLRRFAEAEGLRIFLQTGGLETVAPLDPETPELLRYALPEFELQLDFRPTDFIQVNAAINRAMIVQAVELLELEAGHRVLDLFCGLGNFSLALARRAGAVVGVEGDAGLVERAQANAAANGIANAEFFARDLYAKVDELAWLDALEGGPRFDRVLIDPPRSGAAELVEHLARAEAPRIVYVACSPETLARDAASLVAQGYRLEAAGIMDMFPHTAHVESMAVFQR